MADPLELEDSEFYFKKACEDGVEIQLIFILDKCQFSSLRAPCVMVKNRHFVVRIPLEKLKGEQLIWGAEVEGYFSVRTDDVKPIHFRSKLVRVYNGPPDSMFLIFPLPERVDDQERRNSRRVNIDRDRAHGFGIWYASLEGGDMSSIPKFVWKPFENEDCQLGELSASGMRLDFPEQSPVAGGLAIGDPVLLKGDFGTEAKPAPIFVLGSVARKMMRRDVAGFMSAGCHFTSFRHILGPNCERWFRAHPQEGIGLINQWLRRRSRSPSLLAYE